MQNFIKTILSAVQTWTKGKIKESIKDSTADWNQNDSNADSYVKNRTHWEETKEVVLVDNLTFDEYDNSNAPQCNFVPKQVYTVVWNGKKYENLVCYFDGSYNIIADSNLGCPFYIDDNGGNDLYIESNDGSMDWIVSISTTQTVIHKLDSKYLNLPTNLATTDDVDNLDNTKIDKLNPVGTGSFSMNRAEGSIVGDYSATLGAENVARDAYTFAAGHGLVATGEGQSVNGAYNNINEPYSFDSGLGYHIPAYTKYYFGTSYSFDATTGLFTINDPVFDTLNNINYSKYYACEMESGEIMYKVEGSYYNGGKRYGYKYTSSYNRDRHLAHIVGNGTSDTARSNAHTLDWDGNAWYSGDVYIGSTSGKDKDEGSKKLATEEFVSSKIAEAELGGEEVDLSGYALKSELPSRVSQLQNDSGYITGYTETDPTVPAWAKAASKPTYTASEVGADSKGTASSVVSAHNTATDAHNDIRLALKDINDRLNAFFGSDDKTLDELSEIVSYITSNKALIDSITTSKVSVSDIINNLTTNVSNKPLSAAQGVVLKGFIDTLSNGKLDASALSEAINTALAQAKASGEFDGKDGAAGATGATGVGIKSITIQEVS